MERIHRAALWLPPVATGVLAWFAYIAGYDAEAGSRAGAEPTAAGIAVALPVVLVGLVQLACALFATLAEHEGQLWACVLVSSLGAALLVLAVVKLDGTPGIRHVVMVAAAMLPPLVPAWVSAVASRRIVEPSVP